MRPERASATDPSCPLDWADYLGKTKVFGDLVEMPDALKTVAGLMRERTYRHGQDILTEGEAGSELFILVEGEASVLKSTLEGDVYRVAILKGESHAVLGEGGLLGSDARSATIRAESACRCLILRRDDFERFSAAHPEWAMPVTMRIARAVMERLNKVNNDLMLLYNALVAEIRGK